MTFSQARNGLDTEQQLAYSVARSDREADRPQQLTIVVANLRHGLHHTRSNNRRITRVDVLQSKNVNMWASTNISRKWMFAARELGPLTFQQARVRNNIKLAQNPCRPDGRLNLTDSAFNNRIKQVWSKNEYLPNNINTK